MPIQTQRCCTAAQRASDVQGGDSSQPAILELDNLNITYDACDAGQWLGWDCPSMSCRASASAVTAHVLLPRPLLPGAQTDTARPVQRDAEAERLLCREPFRGLSFQLPSRQRHACTHVAGSSEMHSAGSLSACALELARSLLQGWTGAVHVLPPTADAPSLLSRGCRPTSVRTAAGHSAPPRPAAYSTQQQSPRAARSRRCVHAASMQLPQILQLPSCPCGLAPRYHASPSAHPAPGLPS